MAIRLENAINLRIQQGQRSFSIDSTPFAGYEEVQIVIDRTRFERNTPRVDTLFAVDIESGGEYIGGVSFGEELVDGNYGARPGQRILWSFARFPIPSTLGPTIDLSIDAAFAFNCTLHVDLFP